jgi:anti-sigma regulatory factor (Ser/Thr protein kinase)
VRRRDCRPAGRRGRRRFERAYDGTSNTLCLARRDVVGWLGERGFDRDLQERAALVLSELATNAVQASPGTAYAVSVCQPDEQSAVVAVTSRTDYEHPPPRSQWVPLSKFALRGRGLMIVDEIADDVEIDLPNRETVVVTATLRSANPGSSAQESVAQG